MAVKKHQRKAVHLKPRHGFLTHRDAIWAAIRELKTFTILDIEHKVNGDSSKGADVKTNVSTDTIKTYVRGLTAANYLQEIEGQPNEKDLRICYVRKRWELIKDIGIDAPRVTRKGEPVTQGKARLQMWKAMKVLGDFNWIELTATASTKDVVIKELDAKDYIKHLHAAGYLKRSQDHQPGSPTRYRFIKTQYTGPLAPMIQRVKHVFDPNLGKVVWPKEGEA